jgi:endonuclease/exonuclease/phosphatase family metal-dependent hydrolase
MPKRVTKTRARALIAATLVLVLGALVATRREPNARADSPRKRHRHPADSSHPHRARRDVPPTSVWASRDACLMALKSGGAARDGRTARIGAWNLHWFPDGRPGDQPSTSGADLDWLACTIAWMRVDVLAIEEVKRPPRGKDGLDALTAKLDALTGGAWRSVLDDCPRASGQHVGFLYDTRHVKLVASTTIGALNPRGEACKDELRPGLSGYFRFPAGLDLSVIAVHLKSGKDERAFADRARSFTAFSEAVRAASIANGDRDVLLLGDMNSMGCDTCEPLVSPSAELVRTDALFAGIGPGVARVPSTLSCSHCFKKATTLLDWAARSELTELPQAARVTVSGACGELGCDALTSGLASQEHLSDHCPIYVDLHDEDRD